MIVCLFGLVVSAVWVVYLRIGIFNCWCLAGWFGFVGWMFDCVYVLIVLVFDFLTFVSFYVVLVDFVVDVLWCFNC